MAGTAFTLSGPEYQNRTAPSCRLDKETGAAHNEEEGYQNPLFSLRLDLQAKERGSSSSS
jgi:hypothetical protein